MDKSEAGKLGYNKTREQLDAARARRAGDARRKHEQEAPTCPHCGTPLPYEKRGSKFCNRSCAASYNNRKSPKRKRTYTPRKCRNCGHPVKSKVARYCSSRCQKAAEHKIKDAQIFESGDLHPHYKTPTSMKNFLLRHREHLCSLCGNTEWEGVPIPLVMDHEDGNADNNSLDNLRLVCGNCDMQLPTFAGRNQGKGRAWRRERYAAGKSS